MINNKTLKGQRRPMKCLQPNEYPNEHPTYSDEHLSGPNDKKRRLASSTKDESLLSTDRRLGAEFTRWMLYFEVSRSNRSQASNFEFWAAFKPHHIRRRSPK